MGHENIPDLFSVQKIRDFFEKAESETSNKVAGLENQRFLRNRPEPVGEYTTSPLTGGGRFSLTNYQKSAKNILKNTEIIHFSNCAV